MKSKEAICMLDDRDFVDKLYGFAYKRCSNSHDAEDLCSDIVLSILRSIHKYRQIDNFYAFAWTVAHRTYADYCEKRKQQSENIISDCYSDEIINIQTNPIHDYIENNEDEILLNKIKCEIAFLSSIYREVMILYYLDEMKTSDIAQKLNISETTVKQRLFSARNTVRKEVGKMDTNNIALKPVRLIFWGSGKPVGNDPRSKAEFSQIFFFWITVSQLFRSL